jgi:YihY family inner membrane protein
MIGALQTRVKKGGQYGTRLIKALVRKYRRDNADVIISSICFYILLTFIPFTLLSIFMLGHVVDISDPAIHLGKYLKNVVPQPYNMVVVTKVLMELNLMSISKGLSGPLGLITLLFFAARLFAIIRPSFRIIFTGRSKSFIRSKGEELFFTLVFALVQAGIFFSFVFGLAVQTRIIDVLPGSVPRVFFMLSIDCLEIAFTFAQFFLLYYFLTPVRDKRMIVISTVCATVLWHLGRQFFEHFVLYIVRIAASFGTFGIFIAFLLWLYYSVFVFVICAELLSILAEKPIREPLPSFAPSEGSPSGELTAEPPPPSPPGRGTP